MKVIQVSALLCSALANGLSSIHSPELVQRLAQLSQSGEAIVDKEYREDTQTVTQDENGDFVVHVKSVIGHQTNDNKPDITETEDEFVVPTGKFNCLMPLYRNPCIPDPCTFPNFFGLSISMHENILFQTIKFT